jgi:hypothetical protein
VRYGRRAGAFRARPSPQHAARAPRPLHVAYGRPRRFMPRPCGRRGVHSGVQIERNRAQLRATQTALERREAPGTPGSLRLGAGRSQVQILFSSITKSLQSAIGALVGGGGGVQFWTPDGPLSILTGPCRATSNQRPHGSEPGGRAGRQRRRCSIVSAGCPGWGMTSRPRRALFGAWRARDNPWAGGSGQRKRAAALVLGP